MFKLYRLKRQLRKANRQKIKETKTHDFESAATYRDEEKKILQELADYKSNRKQNIFFKLFSVHQLEYLRGIYLQQKGEDIPEYLPYYYFSRELNFYLECFFAEHGAFKFDWNEHFYKRKNMIKEVTEYYFITEILDHLTRCSCNLNNQRCKYELTRNDIDDVIHSNLFLKLFSMPVEQRKVFSEHKEKSDRKIIVAKDENNNPTGYYAKFHYKLPHKLRLKKEGGDFVISIPFMKLKFHVVCIGKERLPKDFSRLLLGFDKRSAQRIDVHIDTYIKWAAFIFPKYWKYAKILRSLKRRLRESFSSDYYFNTFDWQTIYLQSRINENIVKEKSTK